MPPSAVAETHRRFIVEEAASVLRHDLRNKLSAVRNAAFYIRRKVEKTPGGLDGDQRVPQFLELIESQLHEAEAVTASRLPAPATGAADERDVAALARELVAGLAPPAGVRVSVDAPDAAVIRGDASELGVALYCLLENAVDSGASAISVRCARRDADGAAVVTIEDDGPGLTGGAASRALEPFFSTRPGRMGLGLNIARRIAARHGGELAIEAAGTRGVRVTLVVRGVKQP
jgi:signal transduction histidine kinase